MQVRAGYAVVIPYVRFLSNILTSEFDRHTPGGAVGLLYVCAIK